MLVRKLDLTCFVLAATFASVLVVPVELRAASSQNFKTNPYSLQVREQISKLKSPEEDARAAAAEALGFLRAYRAGDALVESLGDASAKVRREAAMSLAWCGAREHIRPLLDVLDDEDWVVRQAACAALNNLTAMEFAYDALVVPDVGAKQAARWRRWWSSVPNDRAPEQVFRLAAGGDFEGRLRAVRALARSGQRGRPRRCWR
jgi:HEAT repeat protein